jgi:uncharacterized protein
MRAYWRQTVGALVVALVLCIAMLARADVAVPPLSGRVVDQTGTLTSGQIATLDSTLASLEKRKGSQIAVLIVPTTAPETVEQYALRVAEAWKVGRKRIDDGALLVVAKNDRTLRIEVGYGLEGALNDATAKRIIDEIIVPQFRSGNFYDGIAAGVDRLVRVVDGEPLPEHKVQGPVQFEDVGEFIPVLLILALVIGGMLRAIFGRLIGAILTGTGVGVIAWLFVGALSVGLIAGVIAFVFTLISGGMVGPGVGGLGRGGGFPGGGGWSGGGSGGGFSGGGGSFGGGGASGRW